MKFGKPDDDQVKREVAENLTPFIHQSDLNGRQVIIAPKSIETGIEGDFGTYDRITADVLVIDGRKTEAIPTIPAFQTGVWISGSKVVPALRQALKDGDAVVGTLVKDRGWTLEAADADVLKAAEAGKYAHYFEGTNGQKGEPPF